MTAAAVFAGRHGMPVMPMVLVRSLFILGGALVPLAKQVPQPFLGMK